MGQQILNNKKEKNKTKQSKQKNLRLDGSTISPQLVSASMKADPVGQPPAPVAFSQDGVLSLRLAVFSAVLEVVSLLA